MSEISFFLSLPRVKLCLALVDGRFVCPCEPGGTHSFESTWAHKTRPLVPTYSRRSVFPQAHKGTQNDHLPRQDITWPRAGKEKNVVIWSSKVIKKHRFGAGPQKFAGFLVGWIRLMGEPAFGGLLRDLNGRTKAWEKDRAFMRFNLIELNQLYYVIF